MKTFTAYRLTVQTVHETSDLINSIGWEGAAKSEVTAVKLKMATLVLFDNADMVKISKIVHQSIDEGVLIPVAEIQAIDLEAAFFASQSNDKLWTLNHRCTPLPTKEEMFLSSSSGGDIYKDNETGELWITMTIGFEKILGE